MKKTTLFLTVLGAFSIITWNAPAVNPETTPSFNEEQAIPHEYEDIVLHGSLATSVGPNAIEAGASKNAVYIQFNQSLGNVKCATYSASHILPEEEMCYCLDSYLGLGYDYIDNNYYCDFEHPISWTITTNDSVFPHNNLRTYYHSLTVQYGQLLQATFPNPLD